MHVVKVMSHAVFNDYSNASISIIRSTSTDYISISNCHSPYDVFMGRQLGLEEGGRREGEKKGW